MDYYNRGHEDWCQRGTKHCSNNQWIEYIGNIVPICAVIYDFGAVSLPVLKMVVIKFILALVRQIVKSLDSYLQRSAIFL